MRNRFSCLLLSLLSLVSLSSHAQRLPQTVKPEHYTLKLTPDLKSATFTGKESIDAVLSEPASTITLNSAEIKFLNVAASFDGKSIPAKVTEDASKQQAKFDFAQKIPAGKIKLEISYTGILNNELRGFYLSKTAKRNYAVTQFESTDARRAFPCFDEPAFKATFDITLVVDKGDTAISNTNVVKDEPLPDAARHAVTFAVTPRMSTYLVVFLVGDFQCLSGSSDGVPIRACATPDQVQYGAFALSAAEYVLHYYNTYFGIKYPMPKLDMIAIPDFEAGAMENFGAITYRETDLLLDSKHASVGAQRRVGLVVAHEMAHQWFGDMVTMQWWDNVWLNEGFANWMENKPIEAWKPEWNMTQEVIGGTQDTLDLDAQHITRTIRAKADTPDEINEMFDGISYGKAGAVLLMVENYLGEETFRQGVHKYLAAHLYSNATAEDFWSAQTEVSHKPVDKIMDSFVSQAGEPLLTFGSIDGSVLPVEQQRFFLNAKNKPETAETWTIPVCFKILGNTSDGNSGSDGNSSKEKCEILSASRQSLTSPPASFLFANAKGKGYYRTSYPDEIYRKLVQHAANDLSPEERLSLLGDTWALMQAGKSTVAAYLDLVAAIDNDSSPEVIDSVRASLNAIDSQIVSTPEERKQLSAWVRVHFAPRYKKIGSPQPGEAPSQRELRAELLLLAAGLGDDQESISEARTITEHSLADPSSVENTLAGTALGIAARNGDGALFNQLQKASTTAPNPQSRAEALHALALFRDPALEKRALDYAVSGQVRNQDAAGFLASEIRGRDTRNLAWQYVQDNWDKVTAQLTEFGGAYIVGATGSFCSADRVDEVTNFFAQHKVAASARTLARARDQINDCVDLRKAQEANLKSWLSKQQP